MARNRRGFTLIEILIVLVVLAVLATLAIPGYITTVERSRRQEAIAGLAATRDSLVREASLRNNTFPTITSGSDFSALDFDPNDKPAVVRRHYNYTIESGSIAGGTGWSPTIERASNSFVVQAERNVVDFATSNAIGGTRSHDIIAITPDGVLHYRLSSETPPNEVPAATPATPAAG